MGVGGGGGGWVGGSLNFRCNSCAAHGSYTFDNREGRGIGQYIDSIHDYGGIREGDIIVCAIVKVHSRVWEYGLQSKSCF